MRSEDRDHRRAHLGRLVVLGVGARLLVAEVAALKLERTRLDLTGGGAMLAMPVRPFSASVSDMLSACPVCATPAVVLPSSEPCALARRTRAPHHRPTIQAKSNGMAAPLKPTLRLNAMCAGGYDGGGSNGGGGVGGGHGGGDGGGGRGGREGGGEGGGLGGGVGGGGEDGGGVVGGSGGYGHDR